MAKTKKRKSTRSTAASRNSGSKRQTASRSQPDAIKLLKADHRQVEQWFEQFEKSRSDAKKQELARNICQALTVHAQIEEEIFYPAFLEATEDTEIHHEAEIEHDGAKKLIAEIEASGPEDDYFDARVKVLSEMIKHHVKEEEQRGGMFAEGRKAGMDMAELGQRLQARKDELVAAASEGKMPSRRGRGRMRGADSRIGA